MKIFETHAHYDDEAFDADRSEILAAVHRGAYTADPSAREGESAQGATCAGNAPAAIEKIAGRGAYTADPSARGGESVQGATCAGNAPAAVGRIVNCGASLKSSKASVSLAQEYDFIYAAVGVHPDEVGELVDKAGTEAGGGLNGFEELRHLAGSPKVVAIGEIGLDYHWDVWPRELQREMFVKQWKLAIELGLPIEIHSRDAAEDTFNIVKEMYEHEKAAGRALRADMHCYSYSVDQAREYLKMGFYFGVGGVVTFKNARKTHELVRELPLERILLETDCPYLAPEPYRGQRNNSALIYRAAQKIAELRGITAEEVCRVTYENACRFFGVTEE